MTKDKENTLAMICLIVGCSLIGHEFGVNVGLGLYFILIVFAKGQ